MELSGHRGLAGHGEDHGDGSLPAQSRIRCTQPNRTAGDWRDRLGGWTVRAPSLGISVRKGTSVYRAYLTVKIRRFYASRLYHHIGG